MKKPFLFGEKRVEIKGHDSEDKDQQTQKTEVSSDYLPTASDEVPNQREGSCPSDSTGEVKEQKPRIGHFGDPCKGWGESPQPCHEPPQEDNLATMALEELFRLLLRVLFYKKIFSVFEEESLSKPIADEVSDAVSQDGAERGRGDDPLQVEETAGRKKSRDHNHALPGYQQAEKDRGLQKGHQQNKIISPMLEVGLEEFNDSVFHPDPFPLQTT
nr:hypothetical protein [Candidatus Manganitrophus noduliformans]